MASAGERKCKGCKKVFRPDRRNRHHQQYCSDPACRAASKAAAQARWLSKPENKDYFRGKTAAARVKAWRAKHPGYRRKVRRSGPALQDVLATQAIELNDKNSDSEVSVLQDIWEAQPIVLLGLIAHIVDSGLQDEITVTAGRLLRLGHDILAASAAQTPGRLASDTRSRGPPQVVRSHGGRS